MLSCPLPLSPVIASDNEDTPGMNRWIASVCALAFATVSMAQFIPGKPVVIHPAVESAPERTAAVQGPGVGLGLIVPEPIPVGRGTLRAAAGRRRLLYRRLRCPLSARRRRQSSRNRRAPGRRLNPARASMDSGKALTAQPSPEPPGGAASTSASPSAGPHLRSLERLHGGLH